MFGSIAESWNAAQCETEATIAILHYFHCDLRALPRATLEQFFSIVWSQNDKRKTNRFDFAVQALAAFACNFRPFSEDYDFALVIVGTYIENSLPKLSSEMREVYGLTRAAWSNTDSGIADHSTRLYCRTCGQPIWANAEYDSFICNKCNTTIKRAAGRNPV